ncbi:MAG: hypothetical protein O3B86_00915 [Planctomycetota bacterium]|nr:hypothetical protein [Planctomycetota bacterium]
MKTALHVITLCAIVGTVLNAKEVPSDKRLSKSVSRGSAAAFDEAVAAQPKLLRISSWCDGSGKIVFASDSVRYEHRHWDVLRKVLFDGEPWTNLQQTPIAWTDLGPSLDLTRAWIVDRHGRDVIALERTADGFDLYLSDSPNGGADYSVTIAIPRRN